MLETMHQVLRKMDFLLVLIEDGVCVENIDLSLEKMDLVLVGIYLVLGRMQFVLERTDLAL